MTKASQQTESGKVNPNHSKSKEDKAAKKAEKSKRRQAALYLRAKAKAEADEHGMTFDDSIPAARFLEDYDKAYIAATTAGPKPPAEDRPLKGKVLSIEPKKGMIAEAVEKAKAEAAAAKDVVTNSAEEAAGVFLVAEAEKTNAENLEKLLAVTNPVPSPTPICDAACADIVERRRAMAAETEKADETGTPVKPAEATPDVEADKIVPEEQTEQSDAVDESGEAVQTADKPLSKNQLKKQARREKNRAKQEARRLEKAARREANKVNDAETTDITPSIEAEASATESTTAANENEPTLSGSEISGAESQPETVAQTESVEQSAVTHAESDVNDTEKAADVAPNTKLPWHKRVKAYEKQSESNVEEVKQLTYQPSVPPEPKRPTQEEIDAASDDTPSETTGSTATVEQVAAQETADTVAIADEMPQVVEAEASADARGTRDAALQAELADGVHADSGTTETVVETPAKKPNLTVVPPTKAEDFYGDSYKRANTALLDAALASLRLAIRLETESKSPTCDSKKAKAQLSERAFEMALKKENEAFAISAMKKAA